MDSTSATRPAGISAATATALVIANMIGVGVFTSLGFQVGGMPSGFSIVALWAVGGVAALCGALSYAELAAALPRSGGEYHFLSEIYHPSVGFLAGWVSASVGFAAPTALAAIAFGTYLQGVFPSVSPTWSALILVWAVVFVQFRGIHAGSVFQDVFTLLKVAFIVALIVAGFAFGHRQTISFQPVEADLARIFSRPFAVSLVYVMYAYSGWNACTYIIGEIRNPAKTVPRALFVGTSVVLVLYVALNAMFLYTTPVASLKGNLDVGLIAGRQIFGPLGGNIVGGLICLGLVSAVSSMAWIGPRVSVVMGEDFSALRWLSRKSKNGIPAVAMLFQAVVVTILITTSTFEKVLLYIQFTLILCSFLTVLGVIILRIRRPSLPRPYKAWGYPFTPLAFLAISLYMMYFVAADKPLETAAGLATLLAGLLIYWVSGKRNPHAAAPLAE